MFGTGRYRLDVMTTNRHPVRIAAQLHPQHGSLDGLLDAAVTAEQLGYDLVYNWDHFYPLYGDDDGNHFESMTMLAAWAARTSRIELGSLVTCTAYRNPDLLADMIRTIDHIAPGRVVLGLGSGWFERDFDEYGYEFGTAGGRIDRLAHDLERITARFARLTPPPTRKVPILIGGSGLRRTLRLVAQYADGWHALFPNEADELRKPLDALKRHCADVGRSIDEIEMGLGVEPEDLDRFLVEEAPALLAMGFTQFTLGFNGPEWNVAAGQRWLAWRDEVNAVN